MLNRIDYLLAGILTLLTGIACYLVAGMMPSHLLRTMDYWFEADTLREVSNMTTVHDTHMRTSVHPLFSLITFTPVYLLKHGLALNAVQAAVVVTSAVGGLYVGMLFVLFRLMGCRLLDAGVFTVLGLCSASSLFWLPLPNTFSWGSVSIMIALSIPLVAERRSLGLSAYVGISALTLSFTVTNWMAGLLIALTKWQWKQAIQLSVNAFCLVVILWGVQKSIFPTADFFVGSHRFEAGSIQHPQSGVVQNRIGSFLFHSVIAPAIRLIDDDGYILIQDDVFRLSQRMSFQFSAPGSGGTLGALAVLLWSALLLIGTWKMVKIDRAAPFRLVLGLFLGFQVLLHLFYGEETFTYSLHFTPLLLAVAAFGTFGPNRSVVLTVAALLAVCAGSNNWQQFNHAVELSRQLTPQRDIMTRMMNKDPLRPWPRGVGHIQLAAPGSPEVEHAYHEPGGDFSPRTPSFGVSFWLCDANGRPVVISQTLPISEIEQTFEPSEHPDVPTVVTRTPHYEARWTRLDAKRWQLRFTNHSAYTPVIVIRSVGPAGGPITSLRYNDKRLHINDKWAVDVTPIPREVTLGDENATDWMTENSEAVSWASPAGWGYARLTLQNDLPRPLHEYELVFTDERIPIQFGRPYRISPVSTKIELPDSRFLASLQAQRALLMMSLVDNETRPGDPTYFHRAWNRQGAYIVTALARAGDPHVSRVLSKFIATHDFVGGAGAEADEAGLAIWSLTEAAKYIADRSHDEWLWPHIRRKAALIEEMLTAREPIVESYFIPAPNDWKHGQQDRRSLIANPSHDGLIVGRVGTDWPLLYVNAVSYQGLRAAGDLAERLGKHSYASRWRDYATAIQASWKRQFLKESIDKATYSVSLWPSTIAEPIRGAFAQSLYAEGLTPNTSHQSIATLVARAHQYLRLGQTDSVWTTLGYIWENQASRGLYTWQALRPASDDVADGWKYIRGWYDDKVITPDYETAALLLLLQQDMLAYVDESDPVPTIVIGAGIPRAWLSQPMTVSGLSIPGGSIAWHWDGHRMNVGIKGTPWQVRLGAMFPDATEISFE